MSQDPYASTPSSGLPGGSPDHALQERSPLLVFVLAFLTLGIYLIYWYHRVYVEWRQLTGRTPTGNEYVSDFLLTIVTCGIWGIYVDYRISQEIATYRAGIGLRDNDTTTAVLLLDIAAYFTFTVTYLISSTIQQEQLNEIVRHGARR